MTRRPARRPPGDSAISSRRGPTPFQPLAAGGTGPLWFRPVTVAAPTATCLQIAERRSGCRAGVHSGRARAAASSRYGAPGHERPWPIPLPPRPPGLRRPPRRGQGEGLPWRP